MTKTFKFQDPSGHIHVLEGPDDATDEQAFAILQQQLGNGNQSTSEGVKPGNAGGPDRETVAAAASAEPDYPHAVPGLTVNEPGQMELKGPNRPVRGTTEKLLRAAGLSVRPLAEAAGSTAGFVGDALNTGINKVAGTKLGMPSEAIARGLDAVLPKPETGTERAVNALASLGYGAMGADPVSRLLAANMLRSKPRAPTPDEARILDAQREGYVFPPSQVPGSPLGPRIAEAFGGKRRVATIAKRMNHQLGDNPPHLNVPPSNGLLEILTSGMLPVAAGSHFGPLGAMAAGTALPAARAMARTGVLSDAGQRMIAPRGMNPGIVEAILNNQRFQQAIPTFANQVGLYSDDDEYQQQR
jgi:hypothetical protein